MGTDIHFFAEKRVADKWTYMPAPADGHSYEEEKRCEEAGVPYECPHPYRYLFRGEPAVNGYEVDVDGNPEYMRDWFDGRNYRLFGMLADVRNGRGFAGCKTGEAVEVIAEPRGWPEDLSPELEAERDHIEHTPSWLTVAEMQAYFERMRTESLTVIGVVDGKTYENLRDHSIKPNNWSGSISGQGIITVAPAIYDMIPTDKVRHVGTGHNWQPTETMVGIADLPLGVLNEEKQMIRDTSLIDSIRGTSTKVDAVAKVFVQATWKQDFTGYTEEFEACLRELVEVANTEPENIRAVFYFDS